MGTNYYWYEPGATGPIEEALHIGKSSAGWCFSLHVYPGRIDTWADWLEKLTLEPGIIVNEYDDIITLEVFIATVTNRSHQPRTPEALRSIGDLFGKSVPDIDTNAHWSAQLAQLVTLGYHFEQTPAGWTIIYPDEKVTYAAGVEEAVGDAARYQKSHRLGTYTIEKYLADNHAIMGPNNLLRHQIGEHCIGHGEGTYDYLVGEFS